MLDREILVVDDEKDLRTMIRSIFESAGYTQVTTVASGEDALALMAKKIPGIIILDVMMPDMDGFELLQEIRAVSKVPVLMLTAKGEAEDRFAGFELGADDYLVKPFLPKELLLRVQAILKRAYPEKERIVTLNAAEVDLDQAEVIRRSTAFLKSWRRMRAGSLPSAFSVKHCAERFGRAMKQR